MFNSHSWALFNSYFIYISFLPTTLLIIVIVSYIQSYFNIIRYQITNMAMKMEVVFEDYFPSMVEKLGAKGFLNELRNGFCLLMDSEKRVITFESLKKNSSFLGLGDMSDDDLKKMIQEGDLNGDGSLDEMEFYVLMFRLSPDLMERSRMLFLEILALDDQEL
ncbi:hypothetical protein Leryth_019623 [Lithospermum erythrorhizon]|nr:hypothetical protein Leryth_019623 [Lithospermum erythrorhizon]